MPVTLEEAKTYLRVDSGDEDGLIADLISTAMEEGLGDLIKRLQDSSTAADATAEAYSLFGTKGGLAFVTAAKEGRISLDGLSTDLSSFSTTVSDTYEGTLDGIDSATTAMNSLKEAGAAVGEVLGDTLAPILQSVAAGLKSFAQWFSNLSPGMQVRLISPVFKTKGSKLSTVAAESLIVLMTPASASQRLMVLNNWRAS